ncbi:hypothetical protein [Streptomyces sp. NPDC001100]
MPGRRDQLFAHYRELTKAYNAHMTFFLTDVYLLPKARASLYVRCVSFRELADSMDVRKPETLERPRGPDPAQSPDWTTVVKQPGSGERDTGGAGSPHSTELLPTLRQQLRRQ